MIKAEIIADSVSPNGKRITTFCCEYPRFIHCFDEKTEILSQVAEESPEFRSFAAVKNLECKVAQYDSNGKITFVYPEANISKQGEQNLVCIDKANKLSMFVTDMHRVYSLKRTTNNEFIEDVVLAKDLLNNYGTRRIPKAGYMEQEQFYSNDELALIAWYVADGHKENSNTSNFHFKKERKWRTVCTLLERCGINHKVFSYEGECVIRFYNPHWVNKCYDGKEKVLPSKATFMTQEGYKIFKQALLESDGCVENQEYNTSSVKLANQIQIIALLHNEAMNVRCYHGIYKQKFQKTNYVSLRHDKDTFSSIKTDKTVYCVTVPSSFVVVRRRGMVFVSGNCELMTHRLFSRNAASSRAIPIEKTLEMVENNPAMPIEWGLNQSGMQAKELHPYPWTCEYAWKKAAKRAVESAKELQDLGLHKQIVNRVLEPFVHMKTLITATEYDNWFWLRCHKDAQPEIHYLGDTMYQLMHGLYKDSVPVELNPGEWHTPYYGKGYWKLDKTTIRDYNSSSHQVEIDENSMTLDEARMISSSCCAQVSYRVLDDSIDKAEKIFNKLVTSEPIHASPFEHIATPMDYDDITLSKPIEWPDGVTSFSINNKYQSGNFAGWIQYRQLIKNNTCWNYEE